MSSDVPQSAIEPVHDVRRTLKRLDHYVIRVGFFLLACLVLMFEMARAIRYVTGLIHASASDHGLPECLFLLGGVCASAAITWYFRANLWAGFLRLLALVRVGISRLFEMLFGAVIYGIHYGCLVLVWILVPLACFMLLSYFDAAITSFLTAPIGIKDSVSSSDYYVWPLAMASFAAWAIYKGTKGIKNEWQAVCSNKSPIDV